MRTEKTLCIDIKWSTLLNLGHSGTRDSRAVECNCTAREVTDKGFVYTEMRAKTAGAPPNFAINCSLSLGICRDLPPGLAFGTRLHIGMRM